MTNPTTYRLSTRWSDADAQGVLNNAVYLTLFEEARLRLCSGLGLLDDEGNFPFLLASTQVQFRSPGRGGSDVDVSLATPRLGRSSFEQSYEVRGPDGTLWCEGTATLVCYDPETGASRPMTDAFRSALEGPAN